MNATFFMISKLLKCNLSEKCVTNILLNISIEALENYLVMAQIYSGKSSRKKNTFN